MSRHGKRFSIIRFWSSPGNARTSRRIVRTTARKGETKASTGLGRRTTSNRGLVAAPREIPSHWSGPTGFVIRRRVSRDMATRGTGRVKVRPRMAARLQSPGLP